MRIIAGTAPEAMEELPAPTHAFIGGSSGNMKEIVELLLEKNPQVRMVINCITLETVGETLSCIKEMQTERSEWKWESEVVQLGVSRSKEIGRYHMMMGENPIYIITIQAHKKENFVWKVSSCVRAIIALCVLSGIMSRLRLVSLWSCVEVNLAGRSPQPIQP